MENEKVFIEIPSELEVRQEIRTIMDKGLVQEKKFSLRRNVLATAAAIFVLLLALGFAFPGYASQLPLIGGIFEMFEADHRDYSPLQEVANEVSNEFNIVALPEANNTVFVMEDGMIKIVNEIDGSVTIMDNVIHNVVNETDGMSLTIKEVVFDGQIVYFTYHVETDRALGDGEHFRISRPELWVDDVDVMEDQGYGTSPGVLQRISEHNYIAIGTLWLPMFSENIEYADLYFTLGNWRVGFPIERIEDEIFEINEIVRNGYFEITITEATISPIHARVFFNFQHPIEYAILGWEFFTTSPVPEGVEANLKFRVSDDLGNEFDVGMLLSRGDDGGYGWFEFIEPLHSEASELIITPFMELHYWYLGEWRHEGGQSVGYDEVIANGGSFELRKVILGEIIIPLR